MLIHCRGAGAPGLCQRAFPPEQGLRGTERPRPLRKLGSHTAPRLCGDILMPLPPRLTSVPARAGLAAQLAGLTWASQPRRRRVRTPEAGPLAGARVRRAGFRPPVVRAHLRRRDPHPEKQTVCSSRPLGRGMGSSLRRLRTAGISSAESGGAIAIDFNLRLNKE